jgi:hypothetical protein
MKGPSEGKGAEVISLIHASVQDVAKDKKNSGENGKVVYLWKIRCKPGGSRSSEFYFPACQGKSL